MPEPSPLTALHGLRPQAFGTKSTKSLDDPIVEPRWAGLRVLAAVDQTATSGPEASIVDQDGTAVADRPAVVQALVDATRADGAIVDGFVVKTALHDPRGRAPEEPPRPTGGSLMTQAVFGQRRNHAKEQARLDAAAIAARTFAAGEPVMLIVVDLVWLDGQSLVDVPLLERKRLLDSVVAESDLIRRGAYVRPPIDTWVGAWRLQGFTGLTFKDPNGRYRPGGVRGDWLTAAIPVR